MRLALDSDASHAVVADSGAAVVIDLRDGRTRRLDGGIGHFGGACFLAEDRIAAADMGARQTVVFTPDGEVVERYDGIIRGLAADRSLLAVQPKPVAETAADGKPAMLSQCVEIRRTPGGTPLQSIGLRSVGDAGSWSWLDPNAVFAVGFVVINHFGLAVVADVQSGAVFQTIEPGGTGPGYIAGMGISPDGRFLVLGTANRGPLRYERVDRDALARPPADR